MLKTLSVLNILLALAIAATGQAAPVVEAYGVPATHKIAPSATPAREWTKGRAAIDMARNEGESFQIVLRCNEPVDNVRVQTSDLSGPGGAKLTLADLRIYKVECVDINAPFEPDKVSDKPNLQPDPLVPVNVAQDRFALVPGQNLVLWVTIFPSDQTRPGSYSGAWKISQANTVLATMTLAAQVRDYALPRRPLLGSMIGLAVDNVYKAHGCKTPEDREKIIRLYFEEYRRARLSPFLYAPGSTAFNPLPDAGLKWEFIKGADGKPTGEVKLDFTGFDREGALHLDRQDAFSAFNIMPYLWARREKDGKKELYLRFTDTSRTAVERLNADGSVNPVFDQLVVATFRGIAVHLAQKGWLDRALYYVTDEPSEDDTPIIRHICELIRRADPRLRTCLTYDPAARPRLTELVENGKSLIDVWIPYCTMYREEVAADQRSKGADYWLYDVSDTCLIPHSGLTNRMMMWGVWQRNATGYLYYLSTWWGRNTTPWEHPSFLLPEFTYQYRTGDGYFFYPPLRKGEPERPIVDHVVPTIRWEMLREGAEDYDTLRLLERAVQQADKRRLPSAAQGRKALAAAHAFADSSLASGSNYGVRDLVFKDTEGWSYSREEGWLHGLGAKRSNLPIEIETAVPDGVYDLALNVYQDDNYRGQPYSRFFVDGRPYSTTAGSIKGGTNIAAGTVAVRGGKCAFTLSSVDEPAGVILYRVGLRKSLQGPEGDIYAIRRQTNAALETLTTALARK
ncbi:MAG: DUF4091 domain-containing protein [Armatimonadota bacterium]